MKQIMPLTFLIMFTIFYVPYVLAADEAARPEAGFSSPESEFELPELVGFDTIRDQASYALGLDIGQSLKNMKGNLNAELLVEAILAKLHDEESRLPDHLIWKSINAYHYELDQIRKAERQSLGEKNLAEGRSFLKENRTREGVKSTGSGLQYEVLEAGEGDSPGPNERILVHFRSMLLDGTEIDNSRKRGDEPVTLSANTVIAGWSEALQLMKPGAKWKLYIPPELAYGEGGAGDLIGPHAVIVMELELIGREEH